MVKWIWEIYYTDVTTAWSSALSPELLYKQGVLAQLWHLIFSVNSEHALHYTYIYILFSRVLHKILQQNLSGKSHNTLTCPHEPCLHLLLFLQLATVLCLSYTPVKGCPEAVKGNLLMLEVTGALRALTALTAPAQPPPGPHPAPGPWPHVSPQSRREAACGSGSSRLKENLSLKRQRDGKADNGLGVTEEEKTQPLQLSGREDFSQALAPSVFSSSLFFSFLPK